MASLVPAVLRDEPQFRLLFAGQALSVIGDQLRIVATPFAVLAIGGGPGAIGVVAGASTVPFLAFSLIGGVWADRLPRHRVMLASDLVRFVLQAVVAALLIAGVAHVWELAAAAVLFGTADAFFAPAVTGILPVLVPAARLQEANALRSLQMSLGHVSGPVLAGVLIALANPGTAIAVDALTFLLSAVALARLRPPAALARALDAAASAVPSLMAELRGGLEEVRSRSWVVGFLGVLGVYTVVVLPAVFVLGPVMAARDLDGASSWAVIVAGYGVGAVIGDVLILRLRPSRPLLVAGLGFVLASGQAAFIGSGAGTVGIAVLELVAGIGTTAGWGLWESTLQAEIPERAISRVSSFDYLITGGLMPVGFVLAGPIAAGIGLHTTLLLETVIGLPCAALVLRLPSVRSIRRPADAPGTASPLPARP